MHNYWLFGLIIATFFTTSLGGFVAFKFHKSLRLLLGFAAGAIISVVFFDILPEVAELSNKLNINFSKAMLPFIVGFLLFHIIEKYILIHHSHEKEYNSHHHPSIGVGSAVALIAHSFLDGVGIGIAFQFSNVAGISVAIAVLAHDFFDGINTVSLMKAHKNSNKKAFIFLVIDSLAPILGATGTLFFQIPQTFSLIYLGLFGGFLLYISASDILPEAHSDESKISTVVATVLGAVLMYLIIGFIV